MSDNIKNIFIIIVIVYIIVEYNNYVQKQEKNKEQNNNNKEQDNYKDKPIDCAGSWENIGTCIIDRCDSSNNNIGLGLQKQYFIKTQNPLNGGKLCEGTERSVDCSIKDYIPCLKCGVDKGAGYVDGFNCNINRCTNLNKTGNGTIGVGVRIDTWSGLLKDSLENCIIPDIRETTCYEENYDKCTCKYTYNKNTCNKDNTRCNVNDKPICYPDLNFEAQLPGGICDVSTLEIPKVENSDFDCNCDIKKEDTGLFRDDDEKCVNNTYTAKRTKIIKITKLDGLEGCKFAKLPNETIPESQKEKGIFRDDMNQSTFQFYNTNDYIGASFNIEQTENINIPNDNRCVCEGTIWEDVTSCPERNNYTLNSSQFIKKQRSRTIKTIPGIICPEQTLTCPRDCSGNWGDWSECNDDGIQTQIFIPNSFTQLNDGNPCPQQRTQTCNVDCAGSWKIWDETGNEWSSCIIDEKDSNGNWIGRCDSSRTGRAIGKMRRKFDITRPKVNQGISCPPDEIADCVRERHSTCLRCGGITYFDSMCQDISQCCHSLTSNGCTGSGTVGRGRITRTYSTNNIQSLPNCIIPQNDYTTCGVQNYSGCTCSYRYKDCDVSKIECINNRAYCTIDHEKTPEISGGICPSPIVKIEIPTPNCDCTVKITDYDNWSYDNPQCNGTILTATKRIRKRTYEKTSGYKGCRFVKPTNETIPESQSKKGIFLNNYYQFYNTNDEIGSTFDVDVEESNISFSGEYSPWSYEWTDIIPCPNPNANLDDSRFTIQQKSTRIFSPAQVISGFDCPERDETNLVRFRTRNCPRNCQGNWNETTPCSEGCPGQIDEVFRITKQKLYGGTDCEYDDGSRRKSSDCRDNCPVNCTGKHDDNWSNCSAPACGPSSTETESSKSGTEYKYWTTFIPSSKGGSCPGTLTQSCSRVCPRDCKGSWGECKANGRGNPWIKTYTRTFHGDGGGYTGCPATGAISNC